MTRTTGAISDEVLLARAYLSRVAEPACIPVWAFVQAAGPVAAAAAIRAGDGPQAVVRATEARREHADPHADLETAQRHGVRLLTPESPDWPHFAFAALEHAGAARWRRWTQGETTPSESGEPMPPLALWARGAGGLASVGVCSIGIVGARAATAYGEHVAAELAYGLASRGAVVVSGGAYGIDAAAHRAALAAGAPTVIVSAGGVERPYPAGNATLFQRVAEAGIVLSESPPGSAPQRHRFLTRNRLIAALSTATVVVEAAARSGAANTAGHCFTLGRPVMAVPGPVTSPMSAGCHQLLRREPEPAILVAGVDDVMTVIGGLGQMSPPGSDRSPGDVRDELDQLDPVARRVFDGLPSRRPARPDEIAVRCGVSALEVIRALPVLELAGLLETSDAGYRIARRLRTPRTASAR